MFNTLGVAFIAAFFAVIAATVLIKRLGGTNIMVLGKKDKRELLFGIGYLALLYVILSNAAALPMPDFINRFFWDSDIARMIGVALCAIGIAGFIVCVANFWKSVRIGVDYENAGKLTTDGIYAVSRNPMYVCFNIIFFGEFLLFPNIGMLCACIIAVASFHIQILKEEKFLKPHYGEDYEEYCKNVRRYL